MAKIKNKISGKNSSITISQDEMKGEWIECPKCSQRLKTKNLEGHARKAHNKKVKIISEKQHIRPKLFTISIAILLIISVSALGYMLYDFTTDDEGGPNDNPPDDDTPPNGIPPDGNTEWWKNYTPIYERGSENDDWWITYPDQHPNSGSAVTHPQWILDALKTQSVVILDHSTGCAPCDQQMADMAIVLEEHGLEVADYDIVADGSDQRAYECFDAYDPNDAQSYVPLTIMLTLMEDGNGNVRVVWHSTEGATGEEWINAYMEDAIYYHHQNIDNWGG